MSPAVTVLLVLLVCHLGDVWAGAAEVGSNSAWSVRTWFLENGLASNWIGGGIAQTPDGYLWVATPAGLSRFDGVQFENRPLHALPGLRSPVIRVIEPSGEGGLWLGMEGGEVLLLGSAAPPRVFSENLPTKQPDCLIQDKSGALWIGYHNGPACKLLSNGVVRIFDANEGVRRGTSVSLAEDNVGQLWLARSSRLGKLQGDRFIDVASLPSGVAHLGAASDGGVWICCGPRLLKYGAAGLSDLAALPLKGAAVDRTYPFEDRGGTLWIGTSAGGLFRYTGATGAGFEKVATPQAKLLRFGDDREGNLWIGTDYGLDRVTPRAIALEATAVGLPFGSVNSISQAADGTLWAVNSNGAVMSRAADHWEEATVPFPDPANCVLCAPPATIWIGTKSGKVNRWEAGKLTTFGPTEGIAAHSVSVLAQSRSGELWIGAVSPNGLYRLRDERVTAIKLPPTAGRVRAIVQDARGDTWVGCSQPGALLRVDGDQLIDAGQATSGTRSIRCLMSASDQSLWIGYDGGGLGRLKGDRLNVITTRQGLYEDTISQILCDDRGWTWFGGDRGIWRVRQQQLNDLADGRIADVQSFHYGGDEELPPLQAIFGQWPPATRSRDGRLWMAMGTALAVIDPSRVREHPDPPPVYIERIVTDEKTIASYDGLVTDGEVSHVSKFPDALRLPPGYHHLEFYFSAPTFSAPQNVHFRYRLEGFEEDWTDVTEPRKASYPRLPAGSYTFRVTACNADGIWNPRGGEISMTVVPFFWQTWWFISAAVSAFGAAMILIARYVSLRRLRRRLEILERRMALDRERARIAKDIHDDLGHDLTQIVLLSDLTVQHSARAGAGAGENGDELDAHLRQIALTAKQGIKSLDETVWAINPRNDTLEDLIDYVGQFVMESLRAAEIRCQLDLPDHPPQRMIPSEARHNLFLAVKEAVNNILRHARASEVRLGITLSGDAMTVVIADNGGGFEVGPSDSATPSSTQDGLRNMDQRMRDVGGTFIITSKPGGGTRVTFTYPVKHEIASC